MSRRVVPPAPPAAQCARRRRLARLLRSGAAAALAGVAACGGDAPRRRLAADAPNAEFLLVAGDSTYWVASGARGVHVRAAPLFLARWDGRFYEVYTSDDDWSYPDAIFSAQRVWRRDLVSGDSSVVLEDSTVVRLAGDYARVHPDAEPLAPDEDAEERPATSATTEVALLDVHGPFLTVERRADLDVAGRPHRHDVARAVLDLRTGRPTSLARLFGDSAARALADRGRRALRSARDSVEALAAIESDSVRARAVAALATVRFDPTSFGLSDVGGAPAVQFVAPAEDDDGAALALPLPPLRAPERGWWREVRASLPRAAADSSEDVWTAGDGLEIVARYRGDAPASVVLRARPTRARAGVRAARGREWALARVALPTRQLFALDRPPLDSVARRALARAFDESSLYGGEVVLVSHRPGATRPARPRALVRRRASSSHPRTTE